MTFLNRGRPIFGGIGRPSEPAPEPVTAATGLPVAAPAPEGGTDDLRAALHGLIKTLDECARYSEDSGTTFGAGEASICRATRRGLLRILGEHGPTDRAEISRNFAERVLLVSEVMTGYRCPACHGLPASHKYPRYRCGCGEQWDLTRNAQYRLSHEHSPRKILLHIVDTGELPEIPAKTRGDR